MRRAQDCLQGICCSWEEVVDFATENCQEHSISAAGTSSLGSIRLYPTGSRHKPKSYLPLSKSKSSIVFESLYSVVFICLIVDFWIALYCGGRLVPRCGTSRGAGVFRDDVGIGFSDTVTTQLSLAELHGNLALRAQREKNLVLPRKHAQAEAAHEKKRTKTRCA